MGRRINPLIAIATNLLLDHLGLNERESSAEDCPELADAPPIMGLCSKQGAVVLILGRRESGKTILSQRLGEIIGKPVYAVSPEQSPPDWIHELKLAQLDEYPPPHSTLILDDIPAYMSSRDYQDSLVQQVERIIPVVRHKRKLILIFSTQSSGLSDRHIMDADVVILKPANLLFGDLERPAVARLYKRVMPIFDDMSEYQQKRNCYVLSQGWEGLCRVNLPQMGSLHSAG